jgi:hypothetical protein
MRILFRSIQVNIMSGSPRALNRRVYRQQVVSEAVSYLRHGRVPSRLRSRTRARFRERWEGFEARKREQDTTDSDEDEDSTYRLFYGDKRVVPTDEVAAIVAAQYNDSKTTGGRDRIYARLCKKFIGVSRRAVMDALRNQEIWQLLRRPHQPRAKLVPRRPVLAKRPWQRLQIDLIDMSRWANWNHGKHWALTVVDVFTKEAFVVPLRDKTGARVEWSVAVHKSLKTSSNPCQPSTNPTNPANPTQTHKLGRTLHRHPELGQRVGPDREEANVERALEYAKECSGMTVDAGAAGQGGRARGAARGQVGGELVG